MTKRTPPKAKKAPGFVRGDVEMMSLRDVDPNPWNPNVVPPHIMASIAHGFRTDGWLASQALLVWATDETGKIRNLIIDGEHRWRAAIAEGIAVGPVVRLHGVSERDAKSLTVKLNQKRGAWDDDSLSQLLREIAAGAPAGTTPADLGVDYGFDDAAISRLLGDTTLMLLPSPTLNDAPPPAVGRLHDRFGAPPFTVLDARQGYWRDRKAAWLSLGIASEIGRAKSLAYGIGHAGYTSGIQDATGNTSIFDPVLCELAYRWFSAVGDAVLDPFAGGSVRGIVAATLGRRYTGVDIALAQVAANREQWTAARDLVNVAAPPAPGPEPAWIVGDSRDVDSLAPGAYDMIFTCPPYFDLERYSDDPRDMSAAVDYASFLAAYRTIIAKSVAALRDNRFAMIVVGDVRDRRGRYVGLVRDTVQAFEDAGAVLYNDAILLTEISTLALRAGRQFASGRKLGKAHQNVLVFIKGDSQIATEHCGAIEPWHPAPDFEPDDS